MNYRINTHTHKKNGCSLNILVRVAPNGRVSAQSGNTMTGFLLRGDVFWHDTKRVFFFPLSLKPPTLPKNIKIIKVNGDYGNLDPFK